MIIIKTKQGDTIEIQEREIWGDQGDQNALGLFASQIRLNGFLMMPRLYIAHESISFIVRTPDANVEGTVTPQ